MNGKIYHHGCDSEYIEKQLYEQGKVIFAGHKQYGLINLQLGDIKARNFYDQPIKYKGLAGSFSMNCSYENSVICKNNILSIPTYMYAYYYALKVSRIDRIYDVNLVGQKTPRIITSSPQEMLSINKLLNDIDANEEVIKVNNSLDIAKKLGVVDIKVPYLLDNLRNEKLSNMSEFLTFCGIKNVNITKKERLVSDEANGNNELTDLDLSLFLSSRQKAVNEINKMYDLNIQCIARTDMIEKINNELDKINKVGDNNDTSNNN